MYFIEVKNDEFLFNWSRVSSGRMTRLKTKYLLCLLIREFYRMRIENGEFEWNHSKVASFSD